MVKLSEWYYCIMGVHIMESKKCGNCEELLLDKDLKIAECKKNKVILDCIVDESGIFDVFCCEECKK